MKGMIKLNSQFYIDKTKLLGKGNYGQVYKGYMLSQNKIIAVKFITKARFNENSDYQRQIVVMQDLAKLKHPNIMSYYGYEMKPEGLYIFIQFCVGGSLTELTKKKISQIRAIKLLRQLLDAMTYINKQNKVHRDLKPDNILLDQNLDLKIADFGLARNVGVVMTKGAGTPLFAAPQVYFQKSYNQKCDVWSAGLILYQILMGKQMFSDIKTRPQLTQAFKKFQKGEMKIHYKKQYNHQWLKLTQKMLTYNSDQRLSFQQLLQYFDNVKDQMQKNLCSKYGTDITTQNDIAEGRNRAKKITPYLFLQNRNKNDDPQIKLNQQRSYNLFSNVQKHLIFFRMKTDFLHKIIKSFTTNSYSVLKNVYKYILMFCSTAYYLSKIHQNYEELQRQQIKTYDGVVCKKDLQQTHLRQWDSLMNDYKKKHTQNIQKFKGVLNKQIIAKITGNYLHRQQQSKIIHSYPNLLNLITQSQNGKFQKPHIYMQIFLRIINEQQPYCSQYQLKLMSINDVKTYVFMRLVGSLDEFFPEKEYKNEDYIRIRRQQLENMENDQVIQFIRVYNKK